VSAFYLFYNNRIGLISETDPLLNNVYQLRTNVANSRNIGLESYLQLDVASLFADSLKWQLLGFVNTAYIDARYLSTENPSLDGNRVELAPEITFKTGVSIKAKQFGMSWQASYTSFQYTDATNSTFTSNAVNGLVPSYWVQDLSCYATFKRYRIEAGCNNLTNEVYFTRRASGYPGPGILPSANRTFYLTFGFKL